MRSEYDHESSSDLRARAPASGRGEEYEVLNCCDNALAHPGFIAVHTGTILRRDRYADTIIFI